MRFQAMKLLYGHHQRGSCQQNMRREIRQRVTRGKVTFVTGPPLDESGKRIGRIVGAQ